MRVGPALLLLAALAGCTGQTCTAIGADTSLRVDTTALTLPAGATARICLDEECTDAELGGELFPQGALRTGSVPDAPTVQVRVTLTDAAGTQVWSGGAAVDTQVVEPNGPGCGQDTVLPTLRATPDGRLTS